MTFSQSSTPLSTGISCRIDGPRRNWQCITRALHSSAFECLLATASVLLIAGCNNAKLAYAPRVPGQQRPAKDVAAVTVVELGKPNCSYQVIGTVFGTSMDELRAAAAANGGDGVYDTECLQNAMQFLGMEYAKVQCDGRAYVCTKGGSRP